MKIEKFALYYEPVEDKKDIKRFVVKIFFKTSSGEEKLAFCTFEILDNNSLEYEIKELMDDATKKFLIALKEEEKK